MTCTFGMIFHADNIRQYVSIMTIRNALSTLLRLFLAHVYTVFDAYENLIWLRCMLVYVFVSVSNHLTLCWHICRRIPT